MTDLNEVTDAIPPGCGPIGLLSSDEFMPEVEPFDRALIAAGGTRIALVLAADPRAAPQSARLGIAHYKRLGAEPFVVEVLERAEATADALPPFDVLFLAGGSPRSLLRALRDTPFWEEALARWRAGATLAGSSAGTMALSEHCQVPGPGDRVPTRWDRGLGPISRCAFAVHATSRPRHWLEQSASAAPARVVAIADATGIILRPGAEAAVYGPGGAWVV